MASFARRVKQKRTAFSLAQPTAIILLRLILAAAVAGRLGPQPAHPRTGGAPPPRAARRAQLTVGFASEVPAAVN